MKSSEEMRRVAILGAGPTGLEAALAAVERGVPFRLYEAGNGVAEHVRRWGHVRLFSPWDLDVSPRMRRHLEAAGRTVPAGSACPTGHELAAAALTPLAALAGVAPHLRTGVRVVSVGREGLLKHQEIGSAKRGARPFRLLLTDASGREWVEHAGAVLDCTGTYGHPNALGDGGIPAPGELGLAEERITRSIPDVLGDPGPWAGKTVLLVGAGHSAQTAACDLAALAEDHPGTRVLWALRSDSPAWAVDPEDPLPERSRLTARAKALSDGGSPAIEPIFGVVVESIAAASGGDGGNGRVRVDLRDLHGETRPVEVDHILALTGAVGDDRLYRQLQVHECYATSGPMKLAAALLGSASSDCLAQESHGADTLVNPEPGFFLLGSKSYGRNNTFLMRVGWQQVEEVFELLFGGEDSR